MEWSVAHIPPLSSPIISFPNLIMDLRDRHSEVAAKLLARPCIPPFQLHTDLSQVDVPGDAFFWKKVSVR